MQIVLGSGTSTPISIVCRISFQFDFFFLFRILVGGMLERWEDPFFRKFFENIFNDNWRDHDPFALEGRLNARTSLHGRPNQSSIFRSFQGRLAMRLYLLERSTFVCWILVQLPVRPVHSSCFPDVLLSNAYFILRPFFSPKVPSNSKDIYDANNWKFGKL